MKNWRAIGILLVLFESLAAQGGYAQNYRITLYTIAGGSGAGTGGGFELRGTVGQPDASGAGAMSGGNYSLTSGFWAVTLPVCTAFVGPDLDHDCDVDADDLGHLINCTLGPAVPQNDATCANARLDADSDVDQSDFAVWQRCYSGGEPARPSCAP